MRALLSLFLLAGLVVAMPAQADPPEPIACLSMDPADPEARQATRDFCDWAALAVSFQAGFLRPQLPAEKDGSPLCGTVPTQCEAGDRDCWVCLGVAASGAP